MDEQNTPQAQNENSIEQPSEILPPSEKPIADKPKRKKLIIILSVIFALLAVTGAVASYVFLVLIPNTPENVLAKAAQNFIAQPVNYTLNGKLDVADHNLPDFVYRMSVDKQGNVEAGATGSLVVLSPTATMRFVDGRQFVKVDGFWDAAELALKYTSAIESNPDKFAVFSADSALTNLDDTWIEIDSYVFDQPNARQTVVVETSVLNLDNIAITSYGEVVETDGVKTREYTLSVSKPAAVELFKSLGHDVVGDALVGVAEQNIKTARVDLVVIVNISDKTIKKISYHGRPIDGTTLQFELVAQEVADITVPTASAMETLGFGIVQDTIFNRSWQIGTSLNDKERIADLKGIKTALEIYYSKNGSYPGRSEVAISTGLDNLLRSKMAGVDRAVFTDPNGKPIGRNGSEYAYVPEDCTYIGAGNYTCNKFFIITTLDNGSDYQLNSN